MTVPGASIKSDYLHSATIVSSNSYTVFVAKGLDFSSP